MSATAVVGVITNPHSRKNRGQAHRAETLQRVLGAHGLVRETRSTEEIGAVLEEFRDRGVAYWVADGGDGCLHWMVNSAAARFGLGEVASALPWAVPANGGTIDFVARHAGVRGRAEQIVQRLVAEHAAGRRLPESVVPTLVMRGVRVVDGADVPFERIGFASAVAGAGSGFFDQYYATGAQGSRAIVEVIARMAGSVVLDAGPWRRAVPEGWLRYGRVGLGRIRARVTVDGRPLPFDDLTVFNVGAFPVNLGGVIKAFQQASPGRLHAVVGDISPFGIMAKLPHLFLGRSVRGRSVFEDSAVEVRAEATGDRLFRPVMDGELIEGVRWLTLTAGPSIRVPRIDARRERA